MNAIPEPTARKRAFETDESRWQAVQSREAAADGRFVYAVATTGVYCRPTCSSRPARRENVSFYRAPADAEAAGFRACKRCRPDGRPPTEMRMEAVARACRLIEEAEEPPSLEDLARTAGVSRFHFHRVFKEIVGVTPRAYAAARRRALVQKELREAPSVTAAIYGAGYNASSRFYENVEAKLGMSPSAYRKGGRDSTIRFALGECSARLDPGRGFRQGRLRHPVRRRSGHAVARPAGPVPEGAADRRRPRVRAHGRKGGRLRRGTGTGLRSAARCARHRLPAARLAGAL
jgi:methylphosphotriester-DNA--protein-cysteine methyltransferase